MANPLVQTLSGLTSLIYVANPDASPFLAHTRTVGMNLLVTLVTQIVSSDGKTAEIEAWWEIKLGVKMLKELMLEQMKLPNESAIQNAAAQLKDAFELGNLSLPNNCEIKLPEVLKLTISPLVGKPLSVELQRIKQSEFVTLWTLSCELSEQHRQDRTKTMANSNSIPASTSSNSISNAEFDKLRGEMAKLKRDNDTLSRDLVTAQSNDTSSTWGVSARRAPAPAKSAAEANKGRAVKQPRMAGTAQFDSDTDDDDD